MVAVLASCGEDLACTVGIQEGRKEDVRSIGRFAVENSPVHGFAYLLVCILKLLRFHDISCWHVFT